LSETDSGGGPRVADTEITIEAGAIDVATLEPSLQDPRANVALVPVPHHPGAARPTDEQRHVGLLLQVAGAADELEMLDSASAAYRAPAEPA